MAKDHGTEELVPTRTRTSTAWWLVGLTLLLALLMLVFILQNGDKVPMDFLWMNFRLPVGVAMLLSAVIGGLVVLFAGIGRVLQLRLAARRHRRTDRAVASQA
jgi:uncharacterized integral membrane protein